EPSAGLDPILSSELDHLLIKINKNLATTMIIVSHELASIKAIAERVIVLDQDGQGIIEQGPPGHLAEYSKVPYVRHFFHRQPHFSFEA
ncbi:MAG TPA: polyamine ABC transporter ATP-binding protein, partial [Desulfohalobiaceae bacterium]|nr:polyamine ABC transporter ATP-binding protein [Desulfohalobiaceae bacterium]